MPDFIVLCDACVDKKENRLRLAMTPNYFVMSEGKVTSKTLDDNWHMTIITYDGTNTPRWR